MCIYKNIDRDITTAIWGIEITYLGGTGGTYKYTIVKVINNKHNKTATGGCVKEDAGSRWHSKTT